MLWPPGFSLHAGCNQLTCVAAALCFTALCRTASFDIWADVTWAVMAAFQPCGGGGVWSVQIKSIISLNARLYQSKIVHHCNLNHNNNSSTSCTEQITIKTWHFFSFFYLLLLGLALADYHTISQHAPLSHQTSEFPSSPHLWIFSVVFLFSSCLEACFVQFIHFPYITPFSRTMC